jgi:hypothetical protein
MWRGKVNELPVPYLPFEGIVIAQAMRARVREDEVKLERKSKEEN